MRKKITDGSATRGQLRIGDSWNAITIIALSQTNPLKAIAEFVENALDAKATRVTIIRGKERGQAYLKVIDNGAGIPRGEDGVPDFKYVATHICDSLKRKLKTNGAAGIQGEFGIGLLSFWTVGEALTLASPDGDGRTWQMRLAKGEPGYTLKHSRALFPEKQGTELVIAPLLPGLRAVSGEKLQWYLAAELRDRIRSTGVKIRILDRLARAEYAVEPRQFDGRLLHGLTAAAPAGELYLELYLGGPDPANRPGLYRNGTRVLDDLTRLPEFQAEPWASGYLQGIIDASFLNLTPGTRDGVIRDDRYAALVAALAGVTPELVRVIAEQRQAEEEKTSREVLKSVQRALREALLALPPEEYDWFDLANGSRRPRSGAVLAGESAPAERTLESAADFDAESAPQPAFFEYAGPLFSVRISPAAATVRVNEKRKLQAIPRDKSRRLVESGLTFAWRLVEGTGTITAAESGATAEYAAGPEPGLARVGVTVRQGEIVCDAEAVLTVTDTILPDAGRGPGAGKQGLPGYTFQNAAGELWRSRLDPVRNVVVINNGHRDFVYAARQHARKLRYICRLFVKELVRKNFPGSAPDDLLERMVELSLYTEENLK